MSYFVTHFTGCFVRRKGIMEAQFELLMTASLLFLFDINLNEGGEGGMVRVRNLVVTTIDIPEQLEIGS